MVERSILVSRQEQEKWLHCLPLSQNNCVKRAGLMDCCGNHNKVQLRGVRPSWPAWCVVLTVCILPPLLVLPAWDICGESYIYSTESKTQCHCHSVLWHTGSHHIIVIFNFNYISLLLTLRKSKLNFLLAVIMPVFQQSPLFFWSCFPTLTWVSLAASHKVQPTAWPSWENLIWVDSRLTAPWVCLALSAFRRLFWGPASHLTVMRIIWSERTWSEQSNKSPLKCLFKMVKYIFCVHFTV